MTLKETGYELWNDGVSASLIRNNYNNYDDEQEENENENNITTVLHRPQPTQNGNAQIQEEEDPKIINQQPIEIGPSNV